MRNNNSFFSKIPKKTKILIAVLLLMMVGLVLLNFVNKNNSVTPADLIVSNFITRTELPSEKTLKATINTDAGAFSLFAKDTYDKNTDHIYTKYYSPSSRSGEIYIENIDLKMGVYVRDGAGWDLTLKPYFSATDDPRTDFVESDNAQTSGQISLNLFSELSFKEIKVAEGEDIADYPYIIVGKTKYSNAVLILGNIYQSLIMNPEFLEYGNFLTKNGTDIDVNVEMYFNRKTRLFEKAIITPDTKLLSNINKVYNESEHKAVSISNFSYEIEITNQQPIDIYVPVTVDARVKKTTEINSVFVEISDDEAEESTENAAENTFNTNESVGPTVATP